MQTTVWKFELHLDDFVRLEMPKGAKILHVGEQASKIYLWTLVDPDATLETRMFRVAGTGHPLHSINPDKYVGTVVGHLSRFVWHVFEI